MNAPSARTASDIPTPSPAFAPVLRPVCDWEATNGAVDEEAGAADVINTGWDDVADIDIEDEVEVVVVDEDVIVDEEVVPWRTKNPGLDRSAVSAL